MGDEGDDGEEDAEDDEAPDDSEDDDDEEGDGAGGDTDYEEIGMPQMPDAPQPSQRPRGPPKYFSPEDQIRRRAKTGERRSKRVHEPVPRKRGRK